VTLLVFNLLGGIGLFLLGMILLTDGLKAFAGESLRKALVHFTGKPFKAFLSGAVVTTLVQSSSATTVAVIGFVSAGLLSFSQALGVVIGASLGTTSTGWIVSVLGLKISVGFYALPLVGVGALVKLLAKGRWPALGMALAGFGIIFIGIDHLQTGMSGLTEHIDLAAIPSTGVLGHGLLALIGIVMTVLMQSSSAATATTLTALHTGAIDFEQAASLVIGTAVGTTVTGALAAIGANTSAKRTALAHVTFNLVTGIVAFLLLPFLLMGIDFAQDRFGLEAGAVSLAAFKTAFILVGVAMFLPFIHPFARIIERILPEKGPVLTRHLDDSVLLVPAVALEATRRALSETACELFSAIHDRLGAARSEGVAIRRAQIDHAIEEIQEFFSKVPPVGDDRPMSRSRVAQVHAIDHLVRLQEHLNPPVALSKILAEEALQPELERTREILQMAEAGLGGYGSEGWLEAVKEASHDLAERRRRDRPNVIRQTALGGRGPSEALVVLDAMRWLDRVGYHTWRITNYLGGDGESETGESSVLSDSGEDS